MQAIKPILAVLIFSLVIILIFALLGKTQQMIVVYEGNSSQQPVHMTPGKFQGSECGMLINDLRYAAQVSVSDGRTWFFDDIGCLAAWLSARPFKNEAKVWVPDLESGEWIDGRQAWYSRQDQTPMSYGFGAHRSYQAGRIGFADMQTAMLKGETMANPEFRKQLMEKQWKQ